MGLISTREGGREGGREVLNEEARVAARCQNIKSSHEVKEPRRAFFCTFVDYLKNPYFEAHIYLFEQKLYYF